MSTELTIQVGIKFVLEMIMWKFVAMIKLYCVWRINFDEGVTTFQVFFDWCFESKLRKYSMKILPK
jgi:hypothetical protein